MTQQELFDPNPCTEISCSVPYCGSIRTAGQTGPILTCAHDLDPETRRRPKGCLNAYQPETAEIPF